MQSKAAQHQTQVLQAHQRLPLRAVGVVRRVVARLTPEPMVVRVVVVLVPAQVILEIMPLEQQVEVTQMLVALDADNPPTTAVAVVVAQPVSVEMELRRLQATVVLESLWQPQVMRI